MKMSNVHRFQKFATQYDVFVSSADGLGTVAYDRAIVKALKSKFTVKKHILKTNEKKTIFVARLNYSTDEVEFLDTRLHSKCL